MDEKDKKEYELAVLVKTEEDLTPVTELLRQHNAEISAGPRAKKIALAYEIKRNKEAVFAYYTFMGAGADVKNLEQELNTKAEVIRSMIIASPEVAGGGEPQSAMPMPGGPVRRTRTMRPSPAPTSEPKSAVARPLSNEALEKKIEEILQ